MAKKQITQLPDAPYVAPGVNPAAMRYAKGAEARKYNQPVAGGPTPPIPHLNAPHQDKMTMADQARMAQGGVEQDLHQPSFFVPSMHKTQPSGGILPIDILPEAAKHDPSYQTGMGSMHAHAQPHLAYKYGVIRNGQHIPPQQLHTGKPGLKKETLEGIQALQNLQREAKEVEEQRTTAKVESASTGTVAGAAARLANGPGDNDTKPLSTEERAKLQSAVDKMDDFDLNTFREMMMKDILNNEEQRKSIEARLQPLDITDIIMTGRVSQIVPVIPGKFEPEFQSVSGEEDLAIKRLVWQEQRSLDAPNQYMLDKYSLMGVALGVKAINKIQLPVHTDANGNFSEEAFMKKFNHVLRLPFHMLSSLGINFFWFDVRVRRLFQADTIKNG